MAKRAATKKVNFTQGWIAKLKAPAEGREIFYDRQTPGMGLTVFPSGEKVFHWFRAVNGKPIWKSLGSFPALSLPDARAAAGDKNTARERWKAAGYPAAASPFAKATAGLTLEQLKDAYLNQHLRQHSKRPAVAERELKWLFDKHLAHWKNRPVDQITADEIAVLHRRIGEKHQRTANVVLRQLTVFYRFAERAHLWKGDVPTKGIKPYHERKRSRFLQKNELPKLFAALSKSPNVDLRDYVLLSLFCGARKSDTLAMKWFDLDLEAGRWNIPNPTKSRQPRSVVLTEEALFILRERSKIRIEGIPFVFPSSSRSGHLTDLKGAWRKLLRAAGLYSEDGEIRLRQHDLRRSFAANMIRSKTPLPVIARALGHSNSMSVTELYARVGDDVLAEAMTESNALMRRALRQRVKPAPAAKLLTAAPREKMASRG